MNNLQTNWRDNFLSYIFIIVSILLVSLFVYPYATEINLLKEENEINLVKVQELENEKNKLIAIWKDLESDWDKAKLVEQYLSPTNENNLIDFFYWYANNSENWISIDNISITKWIVWSKGFDEIRIRLSLSVNSEKNLLDFTDYLISDDSNYKIFIGELSYDLSKKGAFQLELPLEVYYK